MTKVFVHAPYKQDLGEAIIRIQEDLMEELKIKEYDFIRISGKKNSLIAVAWHMESGDKHSVRLDFPFLQALKITFGDSVDIVKIN